MIRIFSRETKGRQVPKCQECQSDKNVVLSTYQNKDLWYEKYWECYRCNVVIKKARD